MFWLAFRSARAERQSMNLKRHNDRETLERIKRWPQMANRFPKVQIYSAEHGAFWRGTGQGYTIDPMESAVWGIEGAYARTRHCGPEKRIQFVEANEELSRR